MERYMLLYNNASRTGKELAAALNAKTTDIGANGNYCINWGAGTQELVRRLPSRWLNRRTSVELASNKVNALNKMAIDNVSTIKYTTDIRVAKDWISDLEDDQVVYCRTLTRASQGRGIVLATRQHELVAAPLYTLRPTGDLREYRVHVVNGQVIHVARKVPQDDVDEPNYLIRSHDNGWRFMICNTNRVHNDIKQLGINAVAALGLDFGAVDLIWRQHDTTGWVIEVNTAPGLEGTSFEKYVAAFEQWFQGEATRNVTVHYKVNKSKTVTIPACSDMDAVQSLLDLLDPEERAILDMGSLRVGNANRFGGYSGGRGTRPYLSDYDEEDEEDEDEE